MIDDNHKKITAKDIMTKKVLSVSRNTSIFDVAKIISEHNFDGIPVIDSENHLLGIVTEYDLIMRTSSVNSSFLQKILGEVYAKQPGSVKEALQEGNTGISSLIVDNIMNKDPLTLKENATFDEVLATFIAHHRVNPIPIVDNDNKVVGIVSRYDILRPLNLLGYSSNK